MRLLFWKTPNVFFLRMHETHRASVRHCIKPVPTRKENSPHTTLSRLSVSKLWHNYPSSGLTWSMAIPPSNSPYSWYVYTWGRCPLCGLYDILIGLWSRKGARRLYRKETMITSRSLILLSGALSLRMGPNLHCSIGFLMTEKNAP